MIALCREHADKADHGSFTDTQIRELKRTGRENADTVDGRFDWLRRELVSVIGGNLYDRCPTIFAINSRPCIWFEQDDSGFHLLNFKLPSFDGKPRATLRNNYWTVTTGVEEVISPPSGRSLEVRYQNGDRFRVEFRTVGDSKAFLEHYPLFAKESVEELFENVFETSPLTVASLWNRQENIVDLTPRETVLGGGNRITGCMMIDCSTAIQYSVPLGVEQMLFPPFDWRKWRRGSV